MNIDQLHYQMALEARRFAEHVCDYCQVDRHSSLAGEVNDLEAGELVSVFYLVSLERLPLEIALTQFDQVIAMRMPQGGWPGEPVAKVSSTRTSFSNYHPRTRVFLDGFEWGIVDNRSTKPDLPWVAAIPSTERDSWT
jgi:hypothetical protein